MRVYNYLYPNFVYPNNKKNVQPVSNVNFTGIKTKTITTTYGYLSKETQKSLKNLHENMNFIHDLFIKLSRNPHKSIAIKNGYAELSQKNRNSGISFDLPDNQGVLTVRRLLKNNNLLRFIIEKDGKTTHFLTDGYEKSVANVNQKNPQLLPRTFKYMLPNEIKESNIEKYIAYTDEKIQKYKTYLEQFNWDKFDDSPISKTIREKNAEKMRKYRARKKQEKQGMLPQDSIPVKTQLEKSDIKPIMNLFQKKPSDFPANLKPVTSPSGNILGFSFQTSDGGILKVLKRLNAKYGGSMAYLSFEKHMQNGEKSYMSIDLQSYKFLKMKEAGKPLIRNHTVYEYTPEEITKRKMVEKFEAYLKEIYKESEKLEKSEQKAQIFKPVKQQIPSEKMPVTKTETQLKDIKPTDTEILKQNVISKAIADAKEMSDLYFKTFSQEFNKNISQKIDDFKAEIDKFIQNFWQKQ